MAMDYRELGQRISSQEREQFAPGIAKMDANASELRAQDLLPDRFENLVTPVSIIRQSVAELLTVGQSVHRDVLRVRSGMEDIGSDLYIARARREISLVAPEQRDNYLSEREASARIEWRTLCRRDDIKSLNVTDSYAYDSGDASVQFEDPLDEYGGIIVGLRSGGRIRLMDTEGMVILLEPDLQELSQRHLAAGRVNALLDRLSLRLGKTPLIDQRDVDQQDAKEVALQKSLQESGLFSQKQLENMATNRMKMENAFISLILEPLRSAEAASKAGELNPSQAKIDLNRLEREWSTKTRIEKEIIYESQRVTGEPAELDLKHIDTYDRIMQMEDVEGVKVYGNRLVTSTKPINIKFGGKQYDLGSYYIGVNVITGEIEIRAVQPITPYGPRIDHPSIEEGKPAFDGISDLTIKALQQKGGAVGLMKYLLGFLKTYDPKSRFSSIERWPEV